MSPLSQQSKHQCGLSLKAASLLQISRWLCGDEADQLLHAVVLGKEEEQPTVLGLALLQDVILLHQLSQRHVLPVQQLVNVGGGVQVKLPKHGGRWEGGHSPGPTERGERSRKVKSERLG